MDLDGRSSYSITNKVVLPAGIGTFIILTNPVSDGRLLVLFDKPATAIICNANGQVIKQQWADKGQQSINVSNMAQGIYLLRAGNENKEVYYKIIFTGYY
ncbi:MAG: T9SS type A sorting domain-containing protein [Bacteroidota bacterium]